jgi:hypothetical protein
MALSAHHCSPGQTLTEFQRLASLSALKHAEKIDSDNQLRRAIYAALQRGEGSPPPGFDEQSLSLLAAREQFRRSRRETPWQLYLCAVVAVSGAVTSLVISKTLRDNCGMIGRRCYFWIGEVVVKIMEGAKGG